MRYLLIISTAFAVAGCVVAPPEPDTPPAPRADRQPSPTAPPVAGTTRPASTPASASNAVSTSAAPRTTSSPAAPTPAAKPAAATGNLTPPKTTPPTATIATAPAVITGSPPVTRAASAPILQTPRFNDLIERIQSGFAMPPLESKLVAQHERWILRNPEYLNRVLDRGGKYLFHIVEELEARQMPTELALLPIVESAFNPQALSSAKAAGLWQFIPSTGRIYDLNQNWWTDQRRDVIESTRAALDYLQKLYELQGNDWFLALASYNWGEGAVMRARKANEKRKMPTDYLSLKMPRETANYVPKLIALRNILANPGEFGVTLPAIPNEPYFAIIEKEQSIDLALAAKFSDMTVEEFVELNPAHHRPVISVSHTSRIILPVDRAASFQDRLQAHQAAGLPLVTWKPYTLKSQETLAAVAKRTGTTTQELIRANSLKRNAQPLPGTVILAPMNAETDEAGIEHTLANFRGSKIIEKEQLAAVYHRVRAKETLARIAQRYGVTQSAIRRLNGQFEGEVQVGQRLLIRPARVQTVVTDPQGRKTVVASRDPDTPSGPKKAPPKNDKKAANPTPAKKAAPPTPAKKAAEAKK
jgi:membrane-bound lytic murein transglycosylase D